MKIWRINLKSDGIDPDIFCINNNLLGVGWAVDGGYTLMDWNDYYDLGMEQYYSQGDKGWWPALNAIHDRMMVDDLCWTRDQNGTYYLGKILGEWVYRDGDEYERADIVNLRPCDWILAGGVDAVPGKVLGSFSQRRAVQAVGDDTVALYSQYLYAEKSPTHEFELPKDTSIKLDLFSLVSSEDCEDFVGMYLQLVRSYTLIPSTCKKDTMKTEFVLKKSGGEKIYVQVKQGVGINKDDYPQEPKDPRKWFLFSTIGQYFGKDADHICCLEPQVIEEFVINNRNLLSDRVQILLGLLDKFGWRN